MSKEPTLAECVDYMRVLMRRSDPLQMTEPERAALSSAIEVCERVQSLDGGSVEFPPNITSEIQKYAFGYGVVAALAWARGER